MGNTIIEENLLNELERTFASPLSTVTNSYKKRSLLSYCFGEDEIKKELATLKIATLCLPKEEFEEKYKSKCIIGFKDKIIKFLKNSVIKCTKKSKISSDTLSIISKVDLCTQAGSPNILDNFIVINYDKEDEDLFLLKISSDADHACLNDIINPSNQKNNCQLKKIKIAKSTYLYGNRNDWKWLLESDKSNTLICESQPEAEENQNEPSQSSDSINSQLSSTSITNPSCDAIKKPISIHSKKIAALKSFLSIIKENTDLQNNILGKNNEGIYFFRDCIKNVELEISFLKKENYEPSEEDIVISNKNREYINDVLLIYECCLSNNNIEYYYFKHEVTFGNKDFDKMFSDIKKAQNKCKTNPHLTQICWRKIMENPEFDRASHTKNLNEKLKEFEALLQFVNDNEKLNDKKNKYKEFASYLTAIADDKIRYSSYFDKHKKNLIEIKKTPIISSLSGLVDYDCMSIKATDELLNSGGIKRVSTIRNDLGIKTNTPELHKILLIKKNSLIIDKVRQKYGLVSKYGKCKFFFRKYKEKVLNVVTVTIVFSFIFCILHIIFSQYAQSVLSIGFINAFFSYNTIFFEVLIVLFVFRAIVDITLKYVIAIFIIPFKKIDQFLLGRWISKILLLLKDLIVKVAVSIYCTALRGIICILESKGEAFAIAEYKIKNAFATENIKLGLKNFAKHANDLFAKIDNNEDLYQFSTYSINILNPCFSVKKIYTYYTKYRQENHDVSLVVEKINRYNNLSLNQNNQDNVEKVQTLLQDEIIFLISQISLKTVNHKQNQFISVIGNNINNVIGLFLQNDGCIDLTFYIKYMYLSQCINRYSDTNNPDILQLSQEQRDRSEIVEFLLNEITKILNLCVNFSETNINCYIYYLYNHLKAFDDLYKKHNLNTMQLKALKKKSRDVIMASQQIVYHSQLSDKITAKRNILLSVDKQLSDQDVSLLELATSKKVVKQLDFVHGKTLSKKAILNIIEHSTHELLSKEMAVSTMLLCFVPEFREFVEQFLVSNIFDNVNIEESVDNIVINHFTEETCIVLDVVENVGVLMECCEQYEAVAKSFIDQANAKNKNCSFKSYFNNKESKSVLDSLKSKMIFMCNSIINGETNLHSNINEPVQRRITQSSTKTKTKPSTLTQCCTEVHNFAKSSNTKTQNIMCTA